ncbi:MAG: hypothetical protein KF760_15190 [Candidatus Eremiobacteraeota bacterium]|nr:hypothetical protein [Candidatus Eremiobacteraeota bacterium]MCW5866382.1 hypothetical protein [Candidatus Eremiobacteraeota bacterium]
MGLSIPGSGLVKKAIRAGGNVAKKVTGEASKRAGEVKDAAVGGVKEAVHLSKEVVEEGAHQGANFGRGVVEWGKGTAGTVTSLVTHPIQTAKAVKSLAENPLLNPSQGILNPVNLAKDAIHGDNPLDRYKKGAEQLKGIGTTLANDYKEQYEKNGAAGVAGYVAPDLALAVLSGGSSSAAKGGATAAAKAAAKEVAEEAVEQGATAGIKDTARHLAKESVKSQVPDAKTISDAERRNQNEHSQNYLEALIGNFSLF